MTDTRQLCTFYLHDLYLGIDVQRIQEVIRYQEMTRVPLAHPIVRGLINLRGQIVTAIDLRRRMGLAPLSEDRLPMNVVIRTEAGPLSLLVDDIGDVLEVKSEDFEQPPDTLRGAIRELIHGTYKLKNRLLLILNCDNSLRMTAQVRSSH